MSDRGIGFLDGLAAGRPLLMTAIVASGLMALAAAGFRQASPSLVASGTGFFIALALMVVGPAVLASFAPRALVIRLFYAGAGAGLILAARRVLLQSGAENALIDVSLALSAAAGASAALIIGAPLWRNALQFGLIGFAATIAGASGGLSLVALDAAQGEVGAHAGAAIAYSASVGAVISIIIAAAFAREFAHGGTMEQAAAAAARRAIAPIAFALLNAAAGGAALAIFGGGAAWSTVYVEAGATVFVAITVLFALTGALSLRRASEAMAVEENRRRDAIMPILKRIRSIAPPSTALAFCAILFILAIIATFDSKTPAALSEIALLVSTFVASLLALVSLRSSIMMAVFLVVATRLCVWLSELFLGAAPSEPARVIAEAAAALSFVALIMCWRDRRDPRRKSRDVAQLALADGWGAFVAASIVSSAAIAASEAAGLWSSGGEAAIFAIGLCLIGAMIAAPLMIATSAIFGRD